MFWIYLNKILKELEFLHKDFDYEFLLKIKHLKGTPFYEDVIKFKNNYEKYEHLFYTIILIISSLIASIYTITSGSLINIILAAILVPTLSVYFKFKIKKVFIYYYYYYNNKIKNNPELLL